MKTTSLELSKKLYEAFGWEHGFLGAWVHWRDHREQAIDRTALSDRFSQEAGDEYICPAYDTDFLLDKLPEQIEDEDFGWIELHLKKTSVGYYAIYQHEMGYNNGLEAGDKRNPAEALGNLALTLKEKGLL